MICEILGSLYEYVHRLTFSKRLHNAVRFPEHRIVSVGNLSAGGTGKTPVTIELASALMQKGKSVLICLRGYGGRSRQGHLVADHERTYHSADVSGDEAVLIGQRLHEVSMKSSGRMSFRVAAGADRTRLIRQFGKGCDMILLDDAFQNPSVHRNLNIVLIDSMIPPERMKLLPCGRFREKLDALERADMVLLTRANLIPERTFIWKERITAEFPGLPLFEIGIEAGSMISINGPLPERKRDSVVAFCGIGNPDSFFSLLEQQGFTIERRLTYSDHHSFTERELAELAAFKSPLVTTEKDLARLGDKAAALPILAVLRPQLSELHPRSDVSLWHRIAGTLTDREELDELLSGDPQ